MNRHQHLIEIFSQKLQLDRNNIALCVTGSVARGEATPASDVDLLLITTQTSSFDEHQIDGVTIEIKSNTLNGFIQKMDENAMNIYQWLDAHAVFQRDDVLATLQHHAHQILVSYSPPEIPKKWLESTRAKILSAIEAHDDLSLGFHTSNILWKIVESIYSINNQPVPPSTTALRRISQLPKLPHDFTALWQRTLAGDLQTRASSTLKLIDYVLSPI